MGGTVVGRELLVVSLGPGRYGLPMECVDQILEYQEPLPPTGAAGGSEGVVDARGHVVPLVRLSHRLGVASCPAAAPAIVVVRLPERRVAVLVDDVHEVILVGFERCERPPPGTDHLDAVVRLDERLLMILDLPALLGIQPARADRAAPAVHADSTGL